MADLIGGVWKLVAIQPVTNILLVLSHYLFNNFGLAIIALTIVIKGLTQPLSMKQLRSTKAMQEIQPKMAELQKKYGNDRQRMMKEQVALYKQMGVSPAGCLLPVMLQLPVWIALYQSISRVLAILPEDFLELSQYLYSWPVLYSRLPPPRSFLWLDLALPDKIWVLPILVGVTMWVQQKQIETISADPQQRSQQRMMLWSMPLMFSVLTLSFPSGLALYWVASNMITIVTQYFITGLGGLAKITLSNPLESFKKSPVRRMSPMISKPAPVATETAEVNTAQEEGMNDDEESGNKRQDSRRSSTKRTGTSKRQSRRNKGNRSKGR
ncbi:MAG: YidC/Oxa1 family membrane protein insertase [Chloroflexota bacterium]